MLREVEADVLLDERTTHAAARIAGRGGQVAIVLTELLTSQCFQGCTHLGLQSGIGVPVMDAELVGRDHRFGIPSRRCRVGHEHRTEAIVPGEYRVRGPYCRRRR